MQNMEKLLIAGTPKTPEVLFDGESGILEIKGRSIPENSIEFYKPMVDWLENYSQNPKNKTQLNIHLEYFNTSSSKCILDIFKKLESLKKSKHDVMVNWFYEEDDEDMHEAGEDYESIVHLPFKVIEVVDE